MLRVNNYPNDLRGPQERIRDRTMTRARLHLGTLILSVALSLLVTDAAWAAAININDTSPDETITVTANDFECGGFSVNGTLIQQGLHNPGSVTVPESDGPVLFKGGWIDLGQSTPGSRTVYLVEKCGPGNKLHKRVSDILQITVSTDGFCGTIAGTFVSGTDPTNNGTKGLGQLPPDVNPDDVFLEDGTPVRFSAAFLGGSITSDQAQRHCEEPGPKQ
jgi:hypothetical protein